MNENSSSFSIVDFLRGSSLPSLYVKIALLALIIYFVGERLVPDPPFLQYSYNTVHNAGAIADALGLDNKPTYDPSYKQGYLRTEYAEISIPGHALPVLEISIMVALLLVWPAHWLARIIAASLAVVGIYWLNITRLAVLLQADHYYPAYFPQINGYIAPLGYMLILVIFFLLYVLVFGRFNRQS